MGIDDKLEKLHQLEVGNVETEIDRIVKATGRIVKASEDFNLFLEEYVRLIDDKMYSLIDNIHLFSPQISELNGYPYSFYPVDIRGDPHRITLYKEPLSKPFKSTLALDIEVQSRSLFTFGFDPDFNPQEIFLRFWGLDNTHRKMAYLTKIIANSTSEFVDSFVSLVKFTQTSTYDNPKDNRLKEESDFIDEIPYVLAAMPNLLARIYEQEAETSNVKAKQTDNSKRDLEALKVSDII